jgi:TolA-binding protein
MDADPINGHRTIIAYWLLSIGNATAWIQSWIVNNVSVGAVVTFCTVALPAIVGGIAYIVQKLGPVILGFIKDLDAARSSTLSGQMGRLSGNIEQLRQEKEGADRLAEIAKDQADRLQMMYEHSEAANEVLLTTITAGNARIEDLNRKLHADRNSAETYRVENETLKRELEDYRTKFLPIAAKVAEHDARIDAVSEYGSKVSHAAEELSNATDPSKAG